MHIHFYVTYDKGYASWGAVVKWQRCRCGAERVLECVPF